MSDPSNAILRPFLRWAGGKQHIVRQLLNAIPPMTSKTTYYEPFLGGGSLFFALSPPRAVLSDSNEALIGTYRMIKDMPGLVARHLQSHAKSHSREYYYRVRTEMTARVETPRQAAAFIYVNRSCFNGIYRVNRKGVFNVPYGKDKPLIPTCETLCRHSEALCQASLVSGQFHHCVETARPGDFVYIDPPYPALSQTASFAHYTPERFSHELQLAVLATVDKLTAKKVNVLVSNASTDTMRELYGHYKQTELIVPRFVKSKGDKTRANELLITNY